MSRLDEQIVSANQALLADPIEMQNLTVWQIERRLKTARSPKDRFDLKERIKRMNYLYGLEQTKISIQRKMHLTRIKPESGELASAPKDGSISSAGTTNENMLDIGGNPNQVIPAGLQTEVSAQGSQNVNDMSDFLGRPVEMDHFFLDVSNKDKIISVWNDFLNLPSIRAKLRNYAYLRGNLHVRISISANQFMGGRVLVSYQPYATLNTALTYISNAVAISPSFKPLLINYLSQAEGSVVIDVRDNTPVEIICPFISTKPMNRLFNKTNIAMALPFPDFEDSGDLYIYTMDLNEFGYDATNTLPYVQVYAWMEEVELGTDTGTQMVIPTEAGSAKGKVRKKKPEMKTQKVSSKTKATSKSSVATKEPSPTVDERETGPVEMISSGILEVATAVEKVSWLAPFATPVKIAAGAVSSIASLFGWSRPIIKTVPGYVKPLAIHNTSHGIGGSIAQKLVLDPLQELTVDASAVAIQYDQMIISSMADRTSYLTNFGWTPEDVPLTEELWACSVHPNLVTSAINKLERIIQPTAMSFAVQPFEFWRADIVFRFDIVTNSFVKGKIAIVYEPNVYQFGLITTSAIELNKQFIRVIDLQETQTFEVKVNWASHRPWLRNVPAASAYALISGVGTPVFGDDYVNGVLYVTPFTSLQGVAPLTTVNILVSVRAENLHVNCFNQSLMPTKRVVPTESGYIDDTCMITQKEVSLLDLNESTADDTGISKKYFGEEILSFRTALKRYVCYDHIGYYVGLANTWMRLTMSHFPASLLPYGATSISRQDLFTYLRYAYMGYRGSIRHLVISNATTSSNQVATAWSSMNIPTNANSVGQAWVSGVTEMPFGLTGASLTLTNTNAGTEVEVPFYSNNLFAFSFNPTNDDTLGTNAMEKYWYRNFQYIQSNIVGVDSGTTVQLLASAGEDFTFLRFLAGAPYSALA